MHVHSWYKSYVSSIQKGQSHQGFKIFFNGAGGTGKSHVIKLIWCDVIYFLQQTMNVDPDQPLVLLTTPTGLAAFNIGGITLHFAFLLNSDNNSSEVVHWKKKSTLQMKLNNTALCVRDEVSMVCLSTFNCICSTLKKITQSNDDWGGISVLAVGDLYQLPSVGQCSIYKKSFVIQKPGDLAPLYGMILSHMIWIKL